jgi:hypothetical protein
MQENRAAPALHHRRVVVAEHDNEIVDVIGAPEGFGAGAVSEAHGPVVGRVGGLVAPAVIGRQRLAWQGGLRLGLAIGAV